MTSSAEQQLCLNICSVPSSSSSSSSSLPCSRKWAKRKKWTSKKQKPEKKKKKSFISPEEEEEDEEAHLQAPPPELTRGAPQKKKRKKEEVKEGGSGSIKTSSLFRHNPEIPEILRPAVAQLKEKVFTSDFFSDLHLHPHLVATLNKVLNVSRLTSVQQQTIPALLSGQDAAVRSQTGSGKTLSYAVPLVQRLQASEPKVSRSDGPLALVVVPTRELALQTYNTFQKLLKPFTWIVPGVLMGGEKKKAEKARIRKGMNVVVSTPGRLADHVQNTLSLALGAVRWLVLDEADRILDLGFDRELTVILNGLNRTGPTRQNVLLSATLSPGVTRLADICLRDPISICVSGPAPSDPPGQSESFAVPEALQQFVVLVPSKVRLVCLAAFILDQCKFSQGNKMIVFVSSCEAVEFLHLLFSSVLTRHAANRELSFLRLHGNMKQEERCQVFHQFSASTTGVLLCTDVAARGLDLPQVTWIVQYTPPSSAAEYVHRVGRTARIGGRGNGLLFLTPAEAAFITELANHNISVSEMKLQDVLSCLMKDDAFKGRGKYHSQTSPRALQQDIRERATVLQTQLEDFVHSDARWVQAAKKALQSFLRAYTTYPAPLKQVFHLRRLHLGHAAKSFGLRDAPQGLSPGPAPAGRRGPGDRVRSRNQDQTRKRAGSPRKNQNQNPGRQRLHPGHREVVLIRSEFSSGLEGGGAKRKRKVTEEEKD
ncbi:probable ATP-dependent RNA helicase DDX31 [Xiphophorus hellerii]|uniref:probable ATP-dependent RNA helicase DDX31 n=1 Tax=Xiphophorus hellerii TaxID=8084 RepID=UPI0013B3839E|nr:probable ATP-dependent RNA helicase DDX31 [Xiphophorus hellerii]XP_032434425.1 probable ATP-dependent RNA helicase DDX31 [Xiphophorus hellerii]XP_032434426.1 probable ATP-dependent RNA helicase DDX31 [Xiphophorus hellerii]